MNSVVLQPGVQGTGGQEEKNTNRDVKGQGIT